MSRRFQELRKECRVKKTELAQKVGVDVRTITNWEKVNGTIPPLDVMDRIASALQISLFEIYSRFMYNPDKLENDVVQNSFFNNTDHPLARPVHWDSDALNLFIRIFQLSLVFIHIIQICYSLSRYGKNRARFNIKAHPLIVRVKIRVLIALDICCCNDERTNLQTTSNILVR